MDCMREKAGYIDWLGGLKAVFPASRVLSWYRKKRLFLMDLSSLVDILVSRISHAIHHAIGVVESRKERKPGNSGCFESSYIAKVSSFICLLCFTSNTQKQQHV
jgi:hypothetical protein